MERTRGLGEGARTILVVGVLGLVVRGGLRDVGIWDDDRAGAGAGSVRTRDPRAAASTDATPQRLTTCCTVLYVHQYTNRRTPEPVTGLHLFTTPGVIPFHTRSSRITPYYLHHVHYKHQLQCIGTYFTRRLSARLVSLARLPRREIPVRKIRIHVLNNRNTATVSTTPSKSPQTSPDEGMKERNGNSPSNAHRHPNPKPK